MDVILRKAFEYGQRKGLRSGYYNSKMYFNCMEKTEKKIGLGIEKLS